MSLTKVSPNDNFRFPASDYNSFIDMARHKKSERNKKTIFTNKNIVQVINQSGIDLPVLSVMEYESNYNPFMDESTITYKIKKPEISSNVSDGISQYMPKTNKKRICVLQEPILNNGIGKAQIFGITKVRLRAESGLDTNKPMRVIKVQDDSNPLTTPEEHTYLRVTNKETSDDLIWWNVSAKLGVIHLGKFQLNEPPFIGIIDCVADTGNTNKIVIKNYYTGKIYHIRGATTSTFRFLTMKPPRPRSVAVIAQYIYSVGGLDYVEIQPFYSSDMESVVKYDDAQTILNNTVLGRRSYKDVIAYYDLFPSDSMRYGEYPL